MLTFLAIKSCGLCTRIKPKVHDFAARRKLEIMQRYPSINELHQIPGYPALIDENQIPARVIIGDGILQYLEETYPPIA